MKILKIIILCFIFIFFNNIYAEDNNEFVIQFFNEVDINIDGVVDKNDIKKFSKKEFDIMDVNEDNIVSKNKFIQFICNKNCQQKKCNCSNVNNIDDKDEILEFWYKLDKNKDDTITYQEKLEYDLENFYIMDINKDGKITIDEVEAQLY